MACPHVSTKVKYACVDLGLLNIWGLIEHYSIALYPSTHLCPFKHYKSFHNRIDAPTFHYLIDTTSRG